MAKWLDRFSRSEFQGIQNANASWKGVPFILQTCRATFGRRLIPNEYPQKDIPFTEDLGRRVRIFTITGTILGDDYLTARDNFIFISEEEGAGELINPYYGSLRLLLDDVEFEDNISVGRVTNFKATYIETGELTFPIEEPDTGGALEVQVNSTTQSLKGPFEKIYDALFEPLVYSDGKLDSLNAAYDAIDIAKSIANIGPTFKRDLRAFKVQAQSIVTSGAAVFDSIIDLITFGIFDNSNFSDQLNQSDSFKALSSLLKHESSAEPTSPGSEGIGVLVQQGAVITMALNTSKIQFTSANEAREFRNVLLTKIDEFIFNGLSDEVTLNFNKLRSVIVQDIDTRSINLPILKTIQPKRTIPSVILSQELYAIFDRAEDIVKRNKIEHPGFIPGGDNLEVLLNA